MRVQYYRNVNSDAMPERRHWESNSAHQNINIVGLKYYLNYSNDYSTT
jgi:hypothetical protein